MKAVLSRITDFLGSRRFFWVVLGFFIFEAVWIALSALYPQAFDEDFHFGLIKTYSHYWLPFLSGQPPYADAYGAVARDPSYLYQYLMSFPYRCFAPFVHSQTAQVIILRLVNVALFGSGLVLFRRLLLRARVSQAFSNVSLLIFALIPIAPQLAAHINYDNLLFLLIAWVCLLTFRAADELQKRKPAARTFLTLAAICLFASQVKYAFVPIFLGVVLFLAFMTYRSFNGKWGKLWPAVCASWRPLGRWPKVVLLATIVISLGLLVQRDGYNLVKYHSFTPNCARVLSVQSCMAYSPWASNYAKHQALKSAGPVGRYNPISYLAVWFYWMWYRLFFAVNGPASSFTNYPPLPLLSAAGAIVGISGIVVVIIWRRRVFLGNPYFAFFLLASALYVLSLWIDGYSQYRYTNDLVTMNGRYLLPILLLLAPVAGKAFSVAFRGTPARKTIITLVVLLLFLQGGGVLTFISRSDASWDWPNSAVVKLNDAARKITGPVIVDGSKYYTTRIWFFN